MPLLYQKRGRWYANLKSYSKWGGGCEAMIPSGQRNATTDRGLAENLLAGRLAELERAKRLCPNPAAASVSPSTRDRGLTSTFGGFAEYGLDVYEGRGKVTARHLGDLRHRARAFAAFIGDHTRLDDVDEMQVHEYLAHLTRRGLSEPTQRHYLNAISLVYRLAGASGLVPKRFNPARDMEDKPKPSRGGSSFLEVEEAALLIDTARHLADTHRPDFVLCHAALAAGLLTGGRRSEVMGLLVADVDFGAERVSFEPRDDRRLKNSGSERTIPLWPQLAEILRPYLNQREAAVIAGTVLPSKYVFATVDGRRFVQDIGKSLDRVAEVAGLTDKFDGEAWRVFRRTYATARLQTMDGDKPIAEYSVERELGHGSGAMLRRVYGKVGCNRHRADVVEYRVEQHAERLVAAIASRDVRLKKLLGAEVSPISEAIATR